MRQSPHEVRARAHEGQSLLMLVAANRALKRGGVVNTVARVLLLVAAWERIGVRGKGVDVARQLSGGNQLSIAAIGYAKRDGYLTVAAHKRTAWLVLTDAGRAVVAQVEREAERLALEAAAAGQVKKGGRKKPRKTPATDSQDSAS